MRRAEIVAGLSSDEPADRAEALHLLARAGDAGDAGLVVPLVTDPAVFDDRTRHDDPPECAQTPVRMVALTTLAALGPAGLTHVFDGALHDPDLRVRSRAARCASTEALLSRLDIEDDRGVLLCIARELLPHGRPEAITTLERLRTGDDHIATIASGLLDIASPEGRPAITPPTG